MFHMAREKSKEELLKDYLRETLREVDSDHYLISLFAPALRQEALWALFLFNHEISKTRFVVTETQLGLIRLQWWREEIVMLYEGTKALDNPVLQGLETAIRDYALPKALFDNLLYAREFDLEGVQPQGLEGLINYADLTTTPLNKLALQITGDDPGEECVQNISVRYTLVQLLRAKPKYDVQGFKMIGEGVWEELIGYLSNRHCERPSGAKQSSNHGESDQDWIASSSTPSRNDAKYAQPISKILKAQNALASIYIKQLKSANFDPANPKLARPPMFKELRVWLGS